MDSGTSHQLAGLVSYIIRRILFMIPVLIGVTMLTYFAGNAAGDPVALVLHSFRNPSAQTIQMLREYYHLGQPVYIRYLYYIWDLLHLNLGVSITTQRPVADSIFAWAWTTLYLQLAGLALALLIGIPAGVYSARHQYSKGDYTITSVAIFGYSMPTFWLGIILIIVFAGRLGWLPPFGAAGGQLYMWWGNPTLDRIAHLILPMAVLGYVEAATFVRLLRGNMLEVLRQDYVLAGYASGLSERTVIWKHAFRNSITPIITVIGLTIGAALGGAPGLETAFSWPGLGYYFAQAALSLDIATVEGITVLITLMVLAANVLLDLIYGMIDPRVTVD